jgi:hypothetical protein
VRFSPHIGRAALTCLALVVLTVGIAGVVRSLLALPA